MRFTRVYAGERGDSHFAGQEILLMEDTTGRGHRTRHVEAQERRSVFSLLDEEKSGTETRPREP